MTEDAPRLIRQARELVRTGRLPGMAAETLADTIAQYERMRARAAQSQHPTPAPRTDAAKPKRKRRVAPSTQSRPTRETPPERASPADTVRKASPAAPPPAPTPKPPASDPAPARPEKPARQPRAPQGPDTAAQAAVAELDRIFADIHARSAQRPADPDPTPTTAQPQPRQLSTNLSTEDLLQELRQLRDANLEMAHDSNLDPCATEQWPFIYQAARELGHRKDVPTDAWPFLHSIIAAHHRWETRQRPRHDPPAQSIRIRY